MANLHKGSQNSANIPVQTVEEFANNEVYWGAYGQAYSQIQAGRHKIFLTQDQIRNGGSVAINEAYDDALSSGKIMDTQKRPEVVPIKPGRELVERRRGPSFKERFIDRRNTITAIGAAWIAFCGVMAINGAMDPHESGTERSMPSSADVGEIRADTNDICSTPWSSADMEPGNNVKWLYGDGRVPPKLTDETGTVLVTGKNTSFTVPRDKVIDKLYICTDNSQVEIIGKVGQLGIKANASNIHISGQAERVYMENETDAFYEEEGHGHPHQHYWGDSKLHVSGQAGDVILHGYDSGDEDILISGEVHNVLESDDNFITFPDVDTRGSGTLGRHDVY